MFIREFENFHKLIKTESCQLNSKVLEVQVENAINQILKTRDRFAYLLLIIHFNASSKAEFSS